MISINRICLLALAIGLLYRSVAQAHEGHEHGPIDPSVRAWTFANTGLQIKGSYLTSNAGKVRVRRIDGIVVSIEIEELIISDKNFIERKVLQCNS